MEAHSLELERVGFDLSKLVRDTAKAFALQASQKDLALTHEIASNFPEELIGDPARLRQVLINLLGSAIKFTPSGRGEIHAGNEARVSATVCAHDSGQATDLRLPKNTQD